LSLRNSQSSGCVHITDVDAARFGNHCQVGSEKTIEDCMKTADKQI